MYRSHRIYWQENRKNVVLHLDVLCQVRNGRKQIEIQKRLTAVEKMALGRVFLRVLRSGRPNPPTLPPSETASKPRRPDTSAASL